MQRYGIGSELRGSDVLRLEVSLEVDEHRGQVAVWVVGNAQLRLALDELRLRELVRELLQVLVDHLTQWNPEADLIH